MTIDRQARKQLQESLIDYMAGRIRTYAFDDHNSAASESPDKSLNEISQSLSSLHSDLIDHPISVGPMDWEELLRVVAFLDTELEIRLPKAHASWPFFDDEEWRAYEHLANNVDIPKYDTLIHGQPIHHWWDRIPSSIGFLILGCILAGVVVLLARL